MDPDARAAGFESDKRALWRLDRQMEKLTRAERDRLNALAQLGARVLEILQECPKSVTIWTNGELHAAVAEFRRAARSLGLLGEEEGEEA